MFDLIDFFNLLFVQIVVYIQHSGRWLTVLTPVLLNDPGHLLVQHINMLQLYSRDVVKRLG